MRWFYGFLAFVFIALLALAGCVSIVYPSCGDWSVRSIDGANCRECVDKVGPYAECSAAYKKP